MCLVGVLLAASATPGTIAAQDVVLHSFTGNSATGNIPNGGLAVDGSNIYGTTGTGQTGNAATNNGGTVYSMTTGGGGFQTLHTFASPSFNSDGMSPLAGVTLVGSTLYGSTTWGGLSNAGTPRSQEGGTIYSINTNGTGYQFFTVNGNFGPAGPQGTPLYSGGLLYTATLGHIPDPDGYTPNFLVSYGANASFSGGTVYAEFDPPTTRLGAAIALDGAHIYGTLTDNGANVNGAIVAASLAGGSPTVLHSFAGDIDGSGPATSLLVVGSKILGTEATDGVTGAGLVFEMNTNGTGFNVLHYFSYGDGRSPGGLTYHNGTLFGIALAGGLMDKGTLWKMNLDGSDFKLLDDFQGGANHAAGPTGPLSFDGNQIYGVSLQGGANNGGTVFTVNVPEPASVVLAMLAAASLLGYSLRQKSRRGISGT